MVQRRPDLFAAYVGTGQFNSLEDDGRDLFAAAMARAKANGDARAIESLTNVSSLPLTDVARMDVVRKLGKSEDISDNPLLVLIAPLISPGYPISKAFSLGNAFEGSRKALFDEEQQVRVERDVPELATPAFLFQGKDDWQVSTPAAVRYFERLRAPQKDITYSIPTPSSAPSRPRSDHCRADGRLIQSCRPIPQPVSAARARAFSLVR
jgi:proline iminopeptidase